MQERAHDARTLPQLEIDGRDAFLHDHGAQLAHFRVEHVDALDLATARELLTVASGSGAPVLVVFRTASPSARRLLREERVSYAAQDGEWFLQAPPVYIERPARARAASEPFAPPTTPPSPFALRASRIPRWLLLHPERPFSPVELARRLALSESTVSRAARALAEDGLVELEHTDGGRVRAVRARDTAGLLDALERAAWSRRRVGRTWDIGAHDLEEALRVWQGATAGMEGPRWALGGVAGAAMVRRAVEPASPLIWIDPSDLADWGERLLPRMSRPGPGTITVQAAVDPFVLSLARKVEDVWLADEVQLYLDCRMEGERALEAAHAIKEAMGW